MKILLANPATRIIINDKYEKFFIKAGSRWPWTMIKRRNKKNKNSFFPFYLAYSAAILKNEGYDVFVIDGVAIDMPDEEFIDKVCKIKPDVLVVETTTHAIKYDIILLKKIKFKYEKVKTILCGAHPTVFAKDILEKNKILDYILLGEYELTLKELIHNLNKGALYPKIEGLAFRKNSEVWISPKKGYIEDINILPFPAFEMFPFHEQPDISVYTDGICTYRPAITLHSSRGCPFQCDFCLWTQVMYASRKYRMFDPKRVVDEMGYVIKKYGAKEIYFDDDDFCVNKKHVLDICREIKRRNLKIKWSCMGDAICTDEEMIKTMAEVGCIFMKFGVESGNREILKNIGKPLNPQKAIEIAKLCRKYKIRTHATFCLGLDGETGESMKDTLRLANKIKFDYAQLSIATPFPGTRYFDKLVEKGYLKNYDWEKFDGTTSCTFDTSYLKGEEIEKFRKKAIISMILHKIVDPLWLGRYLSRSIIVARNQGLDAVLEPIKAFYYRIFK